MRANAARIVILILLTVGEFTAAFRIQEPATGSIRGAILQAGTNEPIAGARITYYRETEASAVRISLTTNADGQFAIAGLDAGTYRLSFAARGYVNQDYGQKIPEGMGAPLELAAGQAVKDVVVRLIRGGNIEGRVRDSDGLPAVGVPVEILQFAYDFEGNKILSRAAITQTDDRGDYRLFWLTPGRYYLRAGGAGRGAARELVSNAATYSSDGNQLSEPFAETFYPNASSIESANTIEIRAGADMKGLDFRIPRQRLFRIRGRVIDTRTGRPPAAAEIAVSGPNWGTGPWADHYNTANGTFELRGLWPGSYKVLALFKDAAPEAARRIENSNQPRAAGFATVRVVDADVEDVLLQLLPPTSLSGRVVLEDAAPIPPGLRIVLQSPEGSVSPFFLPNWLSAPVNPDGSFHVPQIVTGIYNVAASESGFYVKQARYGGSDVLNSPLNFGGTESSTLDVVLSSKVAQISGTITDKLLQPAAGARVVLVPDKRRDNPQLFHETTTDARGRYSLTGIWPGAYKLFAWEAIDYNAWLDANVLKKHEQDGRAVQLRESGQEIVDVRQIPAEPE